MPSLRLTEKAVAHAPAPARGRIELWDRLLPGFGLRITENGAKTWCVMYRIAGKKRRLTLGTYPAKELAQARDEAREALQNVERGVDPAEEKRTARSRSPDTIEGVIELFMKRYLEARERSPRYIEETRRNFDRHVLPRWRNRDIQSITRHDVIELLDAIVDEGARPKRGKRAKTGGPIAANRTLAAVRKLFNWAIARDIISATPVVGIEPPGEEKKRERVLKLDEIVTLWHAAGKTGYPFGPFTQLALLTAQRRTELATMRGEEIDEERALWIIPGEKTKNGRVHVVPLSPLALEIIKRLPCFVDDKPEREPDDAPAKKGVGYIFTTRKNRPISGFSKFKLSLKKTADELTADESAEFAKLAPWTIHDLRRTAATGMGELGISRFIIGQVLNHSDSSVTGIYDRFEYLEEKRRAFEAWGRRVHALIKPEAHATNVLPLRA